MNNAEGLYMNDSSIYINLAQAAILLGLVLIAGGTAFRLLRNREELLQEWDRTFLATLSRLVQESAANKSMLLQVFVIIALSVLLGLLLGFMFTDYQYLTYPTRVVSIYLALYLLLVIPLILRFVVSLSALNQGARQLAAGNFDVAIPEKGQWMLSSLAQHLNHMRLTIQQSVEEQTKNERLKSELITNVSHDLKTPLTSIINYVDLLKKHSITSTETLPYIEVLEQKSLRLKTLIDDLFEVSKIVSGAVKLHYEKVDMAALLQQALAEFSDEIQASTLTFRVQNHQPPIFVQLDGKQTWRVFENLISNALKYSLPNTRVYISLTELTDRVMFTMQNVSAYEIDYEVNELFERFKRGDPSRSTEGSGLGLAIAKSIIELQGGQLRIELDGDQFKVILLLPKNQQKEPCILTV
ncbi:HAMP domain-containing sensor histidine kinase [Paenibacillus periandrae]|uniref:HAMP domain-containing sensor histidine kinase n=1 Tax=Paenibacillus periandrae TaxID=1761741 RepID=UPI001F092C5E|nr:HAMP domain-containing sensor histidine kinase [Paenibacillus periandrae]